MRKLIPLIFLILSINCFAQFKTVYPDRTTFYKNINLGFVPVKIESQKIAAEDTLYNNYRVFTINQPGNGNDECGATSKGWSWLGKSIIMTKDKKEIFVNKNGDSVIFHKEPKLNDTWTFFAGEDHFYATVIKKEEETISILGTDVVDSVMTISIQGAFHKFNGKEWKISKKYGFVKAYDILNFPEDTNSFVLAGVDKFNIGVKNLTETEIFSFEVGDEMHIREFENSEYPKDKKIIQRVLEKTLNETNDTIIYKIAVLENHSIKSQSGDEFYVNQDTTFLKVALNPLNSEVNELAIKSIGAGYNLQYIDNVTLYMAKKLIRLFYLPSVAEDSCLHQGLGSNMDSDDKYIQGLGGPYYTRSISIFSYGRELEYYKKGLDEWGTPLNLVLGVHAKLNSSINVSPNPATDRIKISSEGIQDTYYKIYNNEGREVLYGSFSRTEETIDINSLRPGIYSMMILKEGGIIYTSRFVKN